LLKAMVCNRATSIERGGCGGSHSDAIATLKMKRLDLKATRWQALFQKVWMEALREVQTKIDNI
jgi:hypothetical protein